MEETMQNIATLVKRSVTASQNITLEIDQATKGTAETTKILEAVKKGSNDTAQASEQVTRESQKLFCPKSMPPTRSTPYEYKKLRPYLPHPCPNFKKHEIPMINLTDKFFVQAGKRRYTLSLSQCHTSRHGTISPGLEKAKGKTYGKVERRQFKKH